MKKYIITITNSNLPKYPTVYSFDAHSDHSAYSHLVQMKNSFISLGLVVHAGGWEFEVNFSDGSHLYYELKNAA